MKSEEILLRSMLFVPAYNKKFIEKSITCDADAIILDMEDSIPAEHRQEARDNIKHYFARDAFKNKTVFIRINEIGSKDFIEDIKQLVFGSLSGYMPSKIKSAEDIVFLDKLLGLMEKDHGIENGKFSLVPLIETAEAVNNAENIACASARMLAICLGGEDYLNDVHCTYIHLNDAILYPRAKIINAARAAGILPIDTPFLELRDSAKYIEEERKMYKMGFAGNLLINPVQIALANECFSPSEEEMEFSKKIIDAAVYAKRENASGIAVYEGTMVGPPMIKRAENVLRLWDLICQKGDAYDE